MWPEGKEAWIKATEEWLEVRRKILSHPPSTTVDLAQPTESTENVSQTPCSTKDASQSPCSAKDVAPSPVLAERSALPPCYALDVTTAGFSPDVALLYDSPEDLAPPSCTAEDIAPPSSLSEDVALLKTSFCPRAPFPLLAAWWQSLHAHARQGRSHHLSAVRKRPSRICTPEKHVKLPCFGPAQDYTHGTSETFKYLWSEYPGPPPKLITRFGSCTLRGGLIPVNEHLCVYNHCLHCSLCLALVFLCCHIMLSCLICIVLCLVYMLSVHSIFCILL